MHLEITMRFIASEELPLISWFPLSAAGQFQPIAIVSLGSITTIREMQKTPVVAPAFH